MAIKPKRDLKKLLKIVEKRKFPKLNPNQKLSLCMIAKNEGANIERCLESVESIVDEIILVDTGSTDDTVEKAKKYGAKVFYSEWKNDFSLARNESIKHATGDWILILDPDEEIPASCRDNLRAFLVDVGDDLYYQLRIKNLDKDDKVSFENYMIRMFRNTPSARYTGRIHEAIYPKNGFINISDDSVHILHHGYKDLDLVNKKITERNLPILENLSTDDISDSYKSYLNFYIGSSHFDLGDIDKAIDYLVKSLELSKNETDNDFTITQYIRLMNIYLIGRRNKELLELLESAPEKSKRLTSSYEYWYYYGVCEFENKNYTKALEMFKKAVDIHEKQKGNLFVLINDISVYYKALYFIAYTYFKLDDKENALKHIDDFFAKIEGEQVSEEIILPSIGFYFELGEYEKSAIACSNLLDKGSKNEKLINTYLTNIYMKLNKFDKAIKIQAKIHDPQNVKQGWYHIASSLEDEKLFDLAENVYTEILEVLPEEAKAYMGRAVTRLIQNKSVDALSDMALAKKYSTSVEEKKKLAMLYSQIGQLNQAKKLFEEVLLESPDDYDVNLYFANIEQADGNFKEAEERLLTISNNNTDDMRASVQLGNLYLATQEIEKALKIFEKSVEKVPDNAYLHYALSLVYMDLNEREKAFNAINRAIEIDPLDEGLQSIKVAIEQNS